jgi:hypothetical protein
MVEYEDREIGQGGEACVVADENAGTGELGGCKLDCIWRAQLAEGTQMCGPLGNGG